MPQGLVFFSRIGEAFLERMEAIMGVLFTVIWEYFLLTVLANVASLGALDL